MFWPDLFRVRPKPFSCSMTFCRFLVLSKTMSWSTSRTWALVSASLVRKCKHTHWKLALNALCWSALYLKRQSQYAISAKVSSQSTHPKRPDRTFMQRLGLFFFSPHFLCSDSTELNTMEQQNNLRPSATVGAASIKWSGLSSSTLHDSCRANYKGLWEAIMDDKRL